jgi:signal transduction histidine kinase
MRQNERDIQFNVDAYTAKLIGRENVSKLEGAVLEVVKNAYDADANVCCLYYSQAQECLYIIDNGSGMDEEILRKHWMTIGNSSKKDTYKSKNDRIQTGAKGIGRFALDRMSDRCEMLTVSDKGGLEWLVNWADFDGNKNLSDVKAKLYDSDESILEYARVGQWKNVAVADEIRHLQLDRTGTVFRLYGLHDDWNEKTRKKLRNHLENLLPPDVVDDFVIYFFDDETDAEDARIISANIDSFDYKISFNVTIDKVSISILRNEFDFGIDEKKILEEAGIDSSDIPYFHGIPVEESFSFEEIGEKENYIGDFDGILFFNKISAAEKDKATFYYKDIKGRANLTKEFGGIKLYRDHFRVRPYGEYGDNEFDWLELSARRNRSPAGLSHPSGRWRAGSEQLVGQVNISRGNTNLEDAANRNGIQEGIGLEQLKRILIFVISEFERDRQSVGRKLGQYKKEKERLQEELERLRRKAEEWRKWEEEHNKKKECSSSAGSADSNKDSEPTVNPQEAQSVIESITEQKEQEIQEARDENRMLQTLATTGIVTNMFMHEIRTLTNNIGLELDSAYDSLKYDKNMEEAFESIRHAIELKKHFASWFRVTIESIRKDKRKRTVCNIKEMLGDYISTWKSILEKDDVMLSVDCENDILFKCFPFDLENVISNLISNSLASFERETNDILEKKEIYISITGEEDGFVLSYEDTGWGLTPKYKKRPELITEAFESDRGDQDEEGTGMGMWIVKKTALEYDGDIDLSENTGLEVGFKTRISFGGKYV